MRDDTNPFPAIFGATEKRLKLFLTLGLLPEENGYVSQALEQWLQMLPLPGEWPAGEDAAFQASLAADLHRTTWHAWGDRATLLPRLALFLEETGAPSQALRPLQEAVATIQPERLGTWMELFDDSVDTGWFFPGERPLAQALSLLDPSSERSALEQWAATNAVDRCLRVGRSIGEGSGYGELLLPLPGLTAEAQLDAARAAFEVLDAPPLPDEVVELLRDAEREGLLLSVWLTEDGISKAGLLLPTPDTILMLKLCALAGEENDEMLAAVEGTLDVQGATYIECQHLAEGFGVELHYILKP